MVGACHIVLGETCLGAYPGVGAFHLHRQNSYMGAYPEVGAYPGDYSNVKYLSWGSIVAASYPDLPARPQTDYSLSTE